MNGPEGLADQGCPDEAPARLSALILENVRDAVITFGLDHRVRTWSPGAARLYGWTAAEAVGKPVYSLIRPEVRPEPFAAFVRRVVAEGRCTETNQRRRKDGTRLVVEATFVAVAGRDGAPECILVVSRDVTEQVEARERELEQQHLRDQERRLALVLEGSSDGFWDWDIESGRVAYGDRWAEMLGYSLDELAPHVGTWEALVHPEDRAEAERSLRALLVGEVDHYQNEHRLRRKDGTWAWILDRGKVVQRAPDGRALRAAGTHSDVSVRKAAEQEARRLHAANEQALKELREALGRVKVLSGLLPICMYCKRIRDDQGYWERLESYISAHSEVLFSHGMCPDCASANFP